MYFIPKFNRGIFNRYHRKMHWTERLTKDMSFAFQWLVNFIAQGFRSGTILCYPHYPSRGSALYKMAKHLHYNITNNPKFSFDIAVYWEYLTYREEYHYLESIAYRTKVVNLYSRDISKTKVDEVFLEVFGYSTKIDPTEYEGKAVCKSDINAIHNYYVIECPIEEKPAEDAFYQVLINNEVENDRVEDIRIPIVKGTLKNCYLKHRQLGNRFKNPIYTKITPIGELLSDREIALINRMAEKMHLELGEIDALRNRDDGKLYIIDVNNTPQGPPSGISRQEGKQTIRELAAAFEERVLSK